MGVGRLLIHADDGLNIEYIYRQPERDLPNTLVFSFTERANTQLNGNGYAGDFLLGMGVDVLAIKSTRFSWHEELAPLVPLINEKLQESGRCYKNRICFGSSMGGHGALRYSGPFRANRVIAISPLFDITNPADKRYAVDIPNLADVPMITPDSFGGMCTYFILYDPYSPDAWHTTRYQAAIRLGEVLPIKIPYSGHPSGFFLAHTGILKSVIEALIGGRPLPRLRGPHVNRLSSANYVYNLADHCYRRNKLRWAASLLQVGITLEPSGAEFHALNSRVLTTLRDWEGAERAARISIECEAANVHRWLLLAELFIAKGAIEQAAEVLDSMVAAAPEVNDYAWLRSQLTTRVDGDITKARIK